MMTLVPRMRLDIGWRDLGAGLLATGTRRDRESVRTQAERAFAADALGFLSVRTGFDALLTALALPAGAEVVLSGVTIPHMVDILRHHGLVPVPVDLDPWSLEPDPSAMEQACTGRTRAILVAHLFGARIDLGPIAEVARARGLLLVEDCAQAWDGRHKGQPEADVSMFSFGTIKTATAMGGALLRVRDKGLRHTLRALRDGRPVQKTSAFRRKLLRGLLLKAVARPMCLGLLAGLTRMAGRDFDALLNAAVRGFSGPGFFERIRHQAPAALWTLLCRRLRRVGPVHCVRRAQVGEALRVNLPSHLRLLGGRGAAHTHWLLPVVASEPEALVEWMRALGFDATTGCSSLAPVDAPPGRAQPERISKAMASLVYLPVSPGMSPDTREQLLYALQTSPGGPARSRRPALGGLR